MKKLDPIRVLLVNVGGPGAPGTIRSLRAHAEREIMLVGIDINPHVPTRALLDVFEVSPRSDDVTFLSFIRDICKREKIDVILPLSSLGIELFEKIAKEPEMPAVIDRKSVV